MEQVNSFNAVTNLCFTLKLGGSSYKKVNYFSSELISATKYIINFATGKSLLRIEFKRKCYVDVRSFFFTHFRHVKRIKVCVW